MGEAGSYKEMSRHANTGQQRRGFQRSYGICCTDSVPLTRLSSFDSSAQSEVELIHLAYVESSICTLCPNWLAMNAVFMPAMRHIVVDYPRSGRHFPAS